MRSTPAAFIFMVCAICICLAAGLLLGYALTK